MIFLPLLFLCNSQFCIVEILGGVDPVLQSIKFSELAQAIRFEKQDNGHFDCFNWISSILYQIQQVLGHLLESKLQYYVPEGFWQVFRLWGSKVNIREQQDALDFFQALIDQLDEQIKVSFFFIINIIYI